MRITINGEARDVDAGLSVRALVETLGLTGQRVAVERNAVLVPKAEFNACELDDGDRLEIVTLVAGG